MPATNVANQITKRTAMANKLPQPALKRQGFSEVFR